MDVNSIWKNLSLALGAEPRQYPVITGSSGIEHEFLAVAVDEKARRIILVSPDPDPRIAALTQVDVQTAIPDVRILMARPIIVHLGVLARRLVSAVGTDQLDLKRFKEFSAQLNAMSKEEQQKTVSIYFGSILERMGSAFQHVTIPPLAQITTILQQAANLDWKRIMDSAQSNPDGVIIPLGGLIETDNLSLDRRYGVCPIPFYELTDTDWTMLNSGDDIDAIKVRLKELGIYQYFFPPIDELTVGFVDRGVVNLTESYFVNQLLLGINDLPRLTSAED
jgi:hypothetical protein